MALVLIVLFAAFALPAASSAGAKARDPRPATEAALAEIGHLLGRGDVRRADSLATAWTARLEQKGDTLSREYVEALGAFVDARSATQSSLPSAVRPAALRALALEERLSGAASPRLIAPLERAAAAAKALGDRAGTRAPIDRALALSRAADLPRDWPSARALLLLGDGLVNNNYYGAADTVLERGVEIATACGVPDSLPLARGLVFLGIAQRYLQRYEQSTATTERAVGIEERLLGPDAPEVGRAINPLAACYRRVGREALMRPLLERSVRILESGSPIDSLGLLRSLSALGAALQGSDPNAAIEMERRAVDIVTATTPLDSLQRARSAGSLALAYWNAGDYLSATEWLRESLRFDDRGFGATNVWGELAVALRAQGDSRAALDAIDRAIHLRRRSPNTEDQVIAWCWWTKGTMHRDLGDDRAAADAFRESARRYRTMPHFIPQAWQSEIEWATSRLALGDAAGAKERVTAVLAEMRPAWAGSDMESDAMWTLAGAEAAAGDSVRAFADAMQAERNVEEGLRNSAWSASDRFALSSSARLQRFRELPLALAARTRDPIRQREAWDMVVRSRALLMDALAARNHGEARAGEDSTTSRLRDALEIARRDIAALALRQMAGPDSTTLAWLRRARLERDRLDNELVKRGAAGVARDESHAAGTADLAWALPDSCALVAFVEYGERDTAAVAGRADAPRTRTRYLAFVRPAHGGRALLVPMPDGARIGSLADRWRGLLGAGAPDARVRLLGDSLRRAVWDPVAAKLGGARRVFVVPDGELSGVSFAALPTGRDRYLIETGPTLHYLSTERDLLAHAPASGRGLLALGDVDFETESARAPLLAASAGPSLRADRSAGAHRAADCGAFKGAHFAPLPGSREELALVSDAWKRGGHDGGACTLLSGAGATEDAFRSGVRGRQVVHLATHAFFIDGDCAPRPAITGAPLTAGGALPYIVRENPLLLSGLVLAGANHHADAKPGEDDGLLTAEEVASLDLAGVDWVVLSACETGLGVVNPGEGILGLRRAFAIAGARTLITSLWKVPDYAARDWMQELYRARFERRLDTAASMRAASLGMLRRLRERGVETDPRLWGAFIATGDWR